MAWPRVDLRTGPRSLAHPAVVYLQASPRGSTLRKPTPARLGEYGQSVGFLGVGRSTWSASLIQYGQRQILQ